MSDEPLPCPDGCFECPLVRLHIRGGKELEQHVAEQVGGFEAENGFDLRAYVSKVSLLIGLLDNVRRGRDQVPETLLALA